MMKDTPGIHNVKRSQTLKKIPIQDRSFGHFPIGRLAFSVVQISATFDAKRINVETHHSFSTQLMRRAREQSASATNIQEALAFEVSELQEVSERILGNSDSLIIDILEECLPVTAKRK
jgi:hypothetical protein